MCGIMRGAPPEENGTINNNQTNEKYWNILMKTYLF